MGLPKGGLIAFNLQLSSTYKATLSLHDLHPGFPLCSSRFFPRMPGRLELEGQQTMNNSFLGRFFVIYYFDNGFVLVRQWT